MGLKPIPTPPLIRAPFDVSVSLLRPPSSGASMIADAGYVNATIVISWKFTPGVLDPNGVDFEEDQNIPVLATRILVSII